MQDKRQKPPKRAPLRPLPTGAPNGQTVEIPDVDETLDEIDRLLKETNPKTCGC